jgi:hypothetical protein
MVGMGRSSSTSFFLACLLIAFATWLGAHEVERSHSTVVTPLPHERRHR